ncbi:SAM-dependent methyltransferase [Brevibacillus ruminantium]|uniref:SAM-dependent methyltransferase n=1 Tax=Brevibacillus ruminantium TaxID=2950604 RepID=A0ABY4WN84_9BACL|nr:SAM-dependent methyltransferase [Brevibacillus ruminantium]USG67532.1 SAM-dependent methyltransferase [Brevibacillus ruminantium]
MTILPRIYKEIEQRPEGAIPFVRFMEMALYDQQGGYYTSARQKIGKDGDFYTSATVHPVFAETLADVVIEMWEAGKWSAPTLVEIGGGTGALCNAILSRLQEAAPALFAAIQVVLVEASPYHRQLQQDALAKWQRPVRVYESLKAAAVAETIEGVILSNEWFDAFPVHLAEKTGEGWQEVYVTRQGEGLQECLREPAPALASFLAEVDERLPKGMRVEVNLEVGRTFAQLAELLKCGYIITIDYGDLQEDLYHPSRKRGTLMCYYRHQVDDNPYVRVGEQDITAHVNFSALIQAGEQSGFQTIGFMRQDQFLIKSGLLEKAVNHQDRDPFTSEAMKRNRAIQQLILPGGLGGLFRVLVQSKGDMPQAGFRFQRSGRSW